MPADAGHPPPPSEDETAQRLRKVQKGRKILQVHARKEEKEHAKSLLASPRGSEEAQSASVQMAKALRKVLIFCFCKNK